MSLILSETGSGLLAAHQHADQASVTAALRSHDRDLRLLWKVIDGQRVWYVVKFLGSERPADWICDWERDGEPLPLSHGLVERVKALDLNSRAVHADPEELNDRLTAEGLAEVNGAIDELARDLVERYRGTKSHLLPRGVYRRNTRFKDMRR